MIIKVCGMRDAENIREVESVGIDMMGFICWEGSPRFVREVPAYLPRCPRVGVFVNPTLEYVKKCSQAFGFSFIQLHGTESPDFCQAVRQETGCKVIKTISIDLSQTSRPSPNLSLVGRGANTTGDSNNSSPYKGEVGRGSLLLFDTKCKTMGGSGRQFNWDILSGYRGEVPFLLSGGIGPEDAERLRQWHHPKCLGIDINSRFETAPGIKDINKIKSFINTIRQHE